MGWCRKKHREDESSVFIVVQVNKMTGEDKRDLVAFLQQNPLSFMDESKGEP